MNSMDRKDRIIQTLAQQIAHKEIINAELLAFVQELEEKIKELEGEKNDTDESTAVRKG